MLLSGKNQTLHPLFSLVFEQLDKGRAVLVSPREQCWCLGYGIYVYLMAKSPRLTEAFVVAGPVLLPSTRGGGEYSFKQQLCVDLKGSKVSVCSQELHTSPMGL